MGWGKKIGKGLKNPKPPKITIAGCGNPVDSFTRPAVVEQNPKPERPDAFCNVPMRLRNLESYPVVVQYTFSYSTEGPNCNSTPSTQPLEATLGAKQSIHLGCSRYKTPNMTCLEIREWKVISTKRAT
jgi:hypothetical protein